MPNIIFVVVNLIYFLKSFSMIFIVLNLDQLHILHKITYIHMDLTIMKCTYDLLVIFFE